MIEDHDTLFVMAEAVHLGGIGVLAYKLLRKKNCGGLSLRTQELTAVFLVVRLFCSFMMEYDVHTILDLGTLAAPRLLRFLHIFVLLISFYSKQNNCKLFLLRLCHELSPWAQPLCGPGHAVEDVGRDAQPGDQSVMRLPR